MTQCFGDFLFRHEETWSWIRNPSASMCCCCRSSLPIILPWWSATARHTPWRTKNPHCREKEGSETLYVHRETEAVNRWHRWVCWDNQWSAERQIHTGAILGWFPIIPCIDSKLNIFWFKESVGICVCEIWFDWLQKSSRCGRHIKGWARLIFCVLCGSFQNKSSIKSAEKSQQTQAITFFGEMINQKR